MYTPSFHSLHHTQFRTNYSLFMPFYDYIYSTMDKSSDDLYERSLKGKEEVPDVVHLTHLTTLQSIYHLRIGFASLASKPYNSKMPILLMWRVAWISMLLTWIYSSSFTVERNGFKKIKMQTWAIPRFKFHYGLPNERDAINDLIEKAILEAEDKGVKVLTLGLLNQVMMTRKHEYYILKSQMPESIAGYLLLSNIHNTQVWLVGDGLEDVEQRTAPKGTLFIPYSSFPPKKVRKDCTYCTTPAMKIPDTVENMHSCENWLPRRVMSASRVAGIVHALEGWDSHECGDKIQDIDKMWSAALRHDCATILLETAIGRTLKMFHQT
ncbi:WAX2 C-terminal domain [Musa troglodytarum]|uniref:WAX2 C-terminal domain n=1 Tax=Musa troglodytarum TaxID=320322 RepID=A0A9E7JGV8_9LILI|nr:WAX2 C-terminal domain [Musa troglodytarum]